MQLLKRVLDARARGEQAVIAQDQHALIPQIRHQTLALVQIQRHALVTVISHPPGKTDRMLGNRQQPIALSRHRNAVAGMGMQDGLQVGTCRVNRAVNHITGRVDAQASRVIDDAAIDVDLDQIRGADFIEQQPEGIDQEMFVRPRHPRGKMRVDVVGPLELGRQPIGRGQFYTHFPFFGRDALTNIFRDAGQWTDATHGKTSWMALRTPASLWEGKK
ncbi:hypothetical protein D3C85_773180 [compost metagenome]